jgi:Ribbon-helix-helix protein, copG family
MVKVVNFSMDESFYKAFRTQARRDDKPMSEIVRQLIAEHYMVQDADTRELESA